MKKLRIAVQIFVFLFITASFFLLSFPFKFVKMEALFSSSPSLVFLTSISSIQLLAQVPYTVIFSIIARIAIFIIIAFLLGRVFCGWICPFGAAMDFMAFIAKPFRKWKEKEPAKPKSKYILLLIFFVLAVLGFQFVWIFEPITVFSRFIYLAFFPFVNGVFDKVFQYLIMNFNIGSELYYNIQNTVFDARQIVFNRSFVFFAFFAIFIFAVLVKRRFWCRYICPLGASLGLSSAKPVFGLKLKECANACGKCRDLCRSNAIRKNGTNISSECVMCMDCTELKCRKTVEVLPDETKKLSEETKKSGGISRRQFLGWAGGFLSALFVFSRKTFSQTINNKKSSVIRPPGALKEKFFKKRCVRCGNCMKICITNGLQPAGFESGLDGLLTPKIDHTIGYCEYECSACLMVCPTHAINPMRLEEKKKFKMGLAEIQKNVCIPWSTGVECLVCEEMCPIPDKAIKFSIETVKGNRVKSPNVLADKCIGCGICQNKCPVIGRDKGIVVSAVNGSK
ncbi:MAG: 4Fe-4S binding protein [Elusimicrobiota bacterium]|jgi:polyferredoxin|nr:4Fe-4S binding protein [Elusimicrobiota bacterium]